MIAVDAVQGSLVSSICDHEDPIGTDIYSHSDAFRKPWRSVFNRVSRLKALLSRGRDSNKLPPGEEAFRSMLNVKIVPRMTLFCKVATEFCSLSRCVGTRAGSGCLPSTPAP
jgi:hypothetical protein